MCSASGKKKKKNQQQQQQKEKEKKSRVIFFLSIFFPFWRKIFLVNPRRKHLGPTTHFPSLRPNQTPSKKFPFFIFSPFFSILPKIYSTKHTLKSILITLVFFFISSKICIYIYNMAILSWSFSIIPINSVPRYYCENMTLD